MIRCDDPKGCNSHSVVFRVMYSFFVQERRAKCDESEYGALHCFRFADSSSLTLDMLFVCYRDRNGVTG